MRVTLEPDSPLMKAISEMFNVDPSVITGIIVHAETPAGTIAMHSLCCHKHYQAALRGLVKNESIPYDPRGN